MSNLFKIAKKDPLLLAHLAFDKLIAKQYNAQPSLQELFANRYGIEIGGPSSYFTSAGYMPIYDIALKVDGCNFSAQTVWEGDIQAGDTYKYSAGKTGRQYICDGVDVPIIPKNNYDFVLSCNNLEHIANPLKAIENWLKLLKTGGLMVLVLPRKESNFDRKRSITSFDHLKYDYEVDMQENDLTHLQEILSLHDLDLDPLAGDFQKFEQRGKNNFENRCLHHHVYDLNLLQQICQHFHLNVVVKKRRAIDYVLIAVKNF